MTISRIQMIRNAIALSPSARISSEYANSAAQFGNTSTEYTQYKIDVYNFDNQKEVCDKIMEDERVQRAYVTSEAAYLRVNFYQTAAEEKADKLSKV